MHTVTGKIKVAALALPELNLHWKSHISINGVKVQWWGFITYLPVKILVTGQKKV